MTRLLVWNIERFSTTTLLGEDGLPDSRPSQPVRPAAGEWSPSPDDRAWLRLNYIVDNVKAFDPDIFVVIEVSSDRGPLGGVPTGTGPQAARQLLQYLRLMSPEDEWMLVPPLRLRDHYEVEEIPENGPRAKRRKICDTTTAIAVDPGYTEAIAVYYKNRTLNFKGPYVWDMDRSVPPDADPDGVGIDGSAYTGEFAGALPEGNCFAGQCEFPNPDDPKKRLSFPWPGSRRPFVTEFYEPATKSTIVLASVHFPPRNETAAGQAFSSIAGYFEDKYQDAMIIIAGDYNINFLNPATTFYQTSITHYNFRILLTPGAGAQPTTYRSVKDKKFGNKTIPAATPGLYLDNGLDNVAFRGVPGETYRCWALPVNRVAEMTMNAEAIPGLPASIPGLLFTPLTQIQHLPGPDEQNRVFRLPQNFGHLGPRPGVSDHLAIFCEFGQVPPIGQAPPK
jgi:hypothetical protein